MIEDLETPDGGSSLDEYASQLERVIITKMARYSQLHKRLGELKELLANEEAISARMHKVPMY